MTRPLAIADQDLALVREILAAHAPKDAKIMVFGSRANGRTKRFSDLDLALDFGHALSLQEHADLAEAFENSLLPYRVDLVDLQTVSDPFRQEIMKTAQPLAFPARFAYILGPLI